MITFEIGGRQAIDPENLGPWKLVYRETDYAFSVDPPVTADCGALVNSVELCFTRFDRRVRFVEGYAPYQSWKRASLVPPPARPGKLYVVGRDFQEGVAYPAQPPDVVWPVRVDVASGWVCMGDPTLDGYPTVQFAHGSVAVCRDGNLKALWLNPIRLPPVLVANK